MGDRADRGRRPAGARRCSGGGAARYEPGPGIVELRASRTLGAGLLGLLAGLTACLLLAGPAGPEPSAWPAALALGAACLLVGLGGLEYVHATASRALIAAVAGCWGAAAVIAVWLQLAERTGLSPTALRVDDLMTGIGTGLGMLICVAGALVVLAWAYRPFAPAPLVSAVAVVGVLAIATSGHGAVGTLWPVLVGVHAVAAAWWIGTLGAMALSVRGRGGWARSLPAYSGYALWAAAVLTLTGVLAAVGELGLSGDWFTTGYGRIVLAKAAGLAVVLALAQWHRRHWLPAAARHRTDEETSLRRAVAEAAVLSVILGLAAGLATTAPGG